MTIVHVRTAKRSISSTQPNLLAAIRVFGGEEALVMWDRDVADIAHGRYLSSFDEGFDNSGGANHAWDCFENTIRLYFTGVAAVWKPEHLRWYVVKTENSGRNDASQLREAILAGEENVDLEELKQEGLV